MRSETLRYFYKILITLGIVCKHMWDRVGQESLDPSPPSPVGARKNLAPYSPHNLCGVVGPDMTELSYLYAKHASS